METKKRMTTFAENPDSRVNASLPDCREANTGQQGDEHVRLSGVAYIMVWVGIIAFCLAAWTWLVLRVAAWFVYLRHLIS